jgi:hypothetical protein
LTYKQAVLKYSKKISKVTSSPQKEIINFLAFITKTNNTQVLKNYNEQIENVKKTSNTKKALKNLQSKKA